MANKEFKIQSDTVSLNGVPLSSSSDGKVVIPGVTRATGYRVEEVEDSGDQTLFFESPPFIIDHATWYTFNANGNLNGAGPFAGYSCEIDSEGHIDKINVDTNGTYTSQESTLNESNDMWIYSASAVDMFSPFVGADWTQIPFRPKMRSTGIESAFSGGGGAGVVQRTVNFPQGEAGDTAGTIALTPGGVSYICMQDYVAPENLEFSMVNTELAFSPQSGQQGASFILADNSDLNDFINNIINNSIWELSWIELSIDGGDTWFHLNGYAPDTTVWGWIWLTTDLANNPGADTEFQLRYTPVAPSIWQQLDNGTLRFNNHLITTNRDLFGGEANVGIFNDNIDIWNYNNTDHSLAEVWLHNDDTSAPKVDINIQPASQGPGDNIQTWSFKHDGSLVFPDGSIQTTAYTGQSGGTSGFLYVMANIDGTVVTSTDGTNWTDAVASGVPLNGGGGGPGDGLGKLEVHGGVIVYTRADVNDANGTGLYYSTVVGTATLCAGTDSFPGGNLYWREVHYFSATDKWVAVGNYNGGSIDYPILAHSTDGINWDLNGIDTDWANTVNDGQSWRFNDVAYNPADNVYVIVGTLDNGSSGVFAISDLTATINDTVWTSTPPNLGAIVYMNVAPYGPTGYMLATPVIGTDDWSTYSPVLDHWISNQGWYDDLAQSNLGYVPDIAEIASDGVTSIVTTNDGQVIVRGILFGMGPGLVSIPLPYTSSISDIVRNQSGDGLATTIAFSGYNPANDGEKITISGVTSHTEGGSTTEQSYNGTYYIKTVNNGPDPTTYELYLDNSLTQPWDTSTYWPVDTGTGTLTWSHGQYLDAAGVAGSTFFVGNDDEQVFKSTDAGVTWTQVQDVNGAYFNDFAYGTFGTVSTFAGDGSLVLPLEDHVGYQTGYGLNGPTLKLRGVDDTQQVIITGPEPTAANRWAPRMVIQGQKGWGPGIGQTGQAGEGGDVYIWAGVGGESDDYAGDGGDIKVRAGQGQNSGNGGYVRIEGGDTSGSTGTGGFIDINAGNVRDGQGDGGDVNIRAGAGQGQGHNNGEVHVWTAGNSNHWVFKNDGTLQLPDNSIFDAAQLTGNGYVGASGYKYTIYANYQGYQGGESDGVLIDDSNIGELNIGDIITFRNGEVRTIASLSSNYNGPDTTFIQWSGGDVEGSEFNPRYPLTIASANYVEETKLTSRIKPDSQTVGTGQYMDIYVGGATVVDNKHVHMAGHDADTELFLGTDNNFVSAKEAGSSPARVNLQSENDITVSNTNLRMSRGNTWISVYGDGVNRNQHNNTWDLAWTVIDTDDQGNSYVGGEHMSYPETIVAKYGPDGDLIWNKMVNADDYNGWQVDGVAYNPVLKEVGVAVQTDANRNQNYYKINTLDSETGDFKSSFDLYDPDGFIEINSMTWHPTLGYVAVGYTHGEFISSSPIPPVITSYSYTTATSTASTELTITDNGSLPAQEPQIGDTVSFNGGIYTIETVTAYSTYYGITANNTDFGVPDPGTAVVLHRGPSALDIIELPVNAVRIGGQWPNINDGSWFISGTNIVGNQTLQGGVGLYYAPVINLTNPTDTGLTVGISISYGGGFYVNTTTGTSGTGVWAYNDDFKILGSNLGGIDGGTNVSGTVDSMTQASANAYAFFTKIDHPDLYNQLNACSWTAQFNTNTYNVISCVENGAYWAVLLQDCTDLTPSSMLFYTLQGNDIIGLIADLNGIQNGFTGVPNVNGLYRIDMAYMGGYNGVDFTGGTFTITTAENNRAFVWTPSWSKVYHPAVVSGTSTAYSVTVEKSTGAIIVGGIDTGADKGFVWKLDVAGTTSWISVINDGGNSVWSVAVSELNGNIYYTSAYNSVNKLNSLGVAISRSEPIGPWGHNSPILMLEQGLDGVEYVYVAGATNSMAWTTQSGFLVNKLTSDFKLVWTRDFYSENRPLYSGYDKFNNQVAMGRDKVVMVGYTNVGRVNNSNAFIASISTTDTFDAVQIGEWHVQTPGGWVGYEDTTTNYEVYNAISNGATVSNSSLLTAAGDNTLTWTNWGWRSTVLKLDKTKGVTGVETIHFAEGGDLDHNPSDIPPVLTDFNSTGWNYTLKLSDRGKFIINEAQPGNGHGDDLYVYIPSNTDVNFPVGTVITLINTNDVENNGYRMYVEPNNYGNSDAPRVYVAGVAGTQGYSRWSFQGIQTATLMKIGSNEWLLTANNITNEGI